MTHVFSREGAGGHITRSLRFVRLPLLASLMLLLFPASRTEAGTASVPTTQAVVRLLSNHEAYTGPVVTSTRIELVRARRPLTGERTVLPVIGATRGWLRVRLPGRPNGHTGWIRKTGAATSTTSWHLVVELGRRRVTVYRAGQAVRVFRAVVGKPSTPTPQGAFFVEEAIQLRATDVGAPFALALSARSNVLQEFDGGPGQIALHGLANVGGVPGTAVSHGCIRLHGATMRWLVVRIGPGVPVTISK